jgi:hypothetical protein
VGVADVLRAGLAEAERSGKREVELDHLSEDEAAELADETLGFLRSRPGRPSSISGWTLVAASKAGVLPWWAEQAALTKESQRRRLRPLQRQIFDRLDEQGLIVKPAKQGASINVSPVPEPTSAELPEGAAGDASPETAGAWILRADPVLWDLGRFVADGHQVVTAWAVEDNDRSARMSHGQRVFLWAGGDGTTILPGIWGVGWTVGPCQWAPADAGYWIDPAAAGQPALFADVDIQLLPSPVPSQRVMDDPRLAAIEVLREPFGTNPGELSPDEAEAMLALVGVDPAPPVEWR